MLHHNTGTYSRERMIVTQDLAKMGAARVSMETFDGDFCILKQNASEVEIQFYEHAAQILEGVNTPQLLKRCKRDLYIEYIPNTPTLSQLQIHNSTFEQLSFLHQSTYRPSFAVKIHEWKNQATDLALHTLNLPITTQSSIKAVQTLSSELFEYPGLISGDTNDGNWGTRNNGDLVLFDWERFGLGSPAIDLAPLVRGLGTLDDYHTIVERYSHSNPNAPASLLLKHLFIAKMWIVVEVINILIRRHNPEAGTYIEWYQTHLPKWLTSMEKLL